MSHSQKIKDKATDFSKRLIEAIGISSIARLDFFVTKNEDVVFNEINAFPGMTKSSLYPRLTELTGLRKGEFINKLLELRCGL